MKKRLFVLKLVLVNVILIPHLHFAISIFKNIFFKVPKNKDKAIIIVPGIGCSTLHYLGKTNNTYKHGECVFFRGDMDTWSLLDLKDSALKALRNYRLLCCNKDGTPLYKNVGLLTDYTDVDGYDVNLSKYGFSLMFKKIIDFLTQKYGENTNYKYKVYLYNYDWRLSNEVNGRALYNELKKYGGGVILIGFSMGNLVSCKAAALLYNDNDLNRIKAFISTFPPYNGSLNAIKFLKTGMMDYPLFNILNKVFRINTVLKMLSLNYPSMYELIPNKQFFKRRKGFLYDTDNCRLNYRQTILYLKNDKNINKMLLNNAVKFHNNLYIGGKHILDYIKNKVFFIGVGYKTEDALLIDRKYINVVKNMSYSDGDGTVNSKFGAYPPCDVDEEDIIYVKCRHNELFSNTKFLIELSNAVDMYV